MQTWMLEQIWNERRPRRLLKVVVIFAPFWTSRWAGALGGEKWGLLTFFPVLVFVAVIIRSYWWADRPSRDQPQQVLLDARRAVSEGSSPESAGVTMKKFLRWALASVLALVTLGQVLLVGLDVMDGSTAGRVILRIAVAAFCGWLTLLAWRAAKPGTPP